MPNTDKQKTYKDRGERDGIHITLTRPVRVKISVPTVLISAIAGGVILLTSLFTVLLSLFTSDETIFYDLIIYLLAPIGGLLIGFYFGRSRSIREGDHE